MKIGRNSPCPCGSGKKYKHCCALRPQPGFDLSRVAGISIDTEEKQLIYVTKDMLINALRRDAPKIEESFDRLHENDLWEMSELLGSSCFLFMQGFKESGRKNDELRIIAGQLLMNAINTFHGAVTLLRDGLYLQAAILVRSILETVATVMHLVMNPSDLGRFKKNEIELKATLPSAKKILPPFGDMYGMFSSMFVHISSLHGKLQPVVPYQKNFEPLIVNIMFLRMSIWLIYVATELLFVDLIEGGKYWERIEPDKVAYRPTKDTLEWQDKFLRGGSSPETEPQSEEAKK